MTLVRSSQELRADGIGEENTSVGQHYSIIVCNEKPQIGQSLDGLSEPRLQ